MFKQVIEIYELLDSPKVSGEEVASLLRSRGLEDISVKTIKGERGQTDFIKRHIVKLSLEKAYLCVVTGDLGPDCRHPFPHLFFKLFFKTT